MLNVIDEFTRACLAIRIGRKLNSIDVIDVLSDLFTLGAQPCSVRQRAGVDRQGGAGLDLAVGAKTAYIEPGSPLQGRCRGPDPCGTGSTALLSMGEWLLRKLQRQAPGRLLNGEIFTTLKRGQDRDRELAKARQQRPPALLTRLPPAGT